MSKRCPKCDKTVYPTEELKCLDKTWHKGCFKCESCGMTLNMKNYKGYNKKPYCNAHYPTTKFTAVADTPELARLAQNSKLQSNIKYHEDFEKNIKGTKTNVVDDPETLRLQQQSKLVSQVEYHGLKKKHDEMEKQRASVSDDVQPTQINRKPSGDYPAGGDQAVPSPYTAKFTGHSTTYGAKGKVEHSQPRRNIGSISDYDPMQENWGSLGKGYAPPASAGGTQHWEETVAQVPRQQNKPNQQPAYYPAPQQQSPRHSYQQQPPPPQQQSPRHSYQQQSPRQSYQQPPPSPGTQYGQQPPRQAQQPARQAQQPPRQAPQKKAPFYQAMYDYEAQDDDEISFRDGDAIVDTEPIDEGWMYGTVERTGKRGMLPANYVEKVQ